MTVATINRGPLTDRLILELSETNLPVGDNHAPEGVFGWQSTDPDADQSQFIPWMVVTAGTASAGTGPLASSASDWKLTYTVFFAGDTRGQLDWLADKIRIKLTNIERENVTTESGQWRIQQIRCTSVGGTVRQGQTFPDYYTQTDLFEVWLSKELA